MVQILDIIILHLYIHVAILIQWTPGARVPGTTVGSPASIPQVGFLGREIQLFFIMCMYKQKLSGAKLKRWWSDDNYILYHQFANGFNKKLTHSKNISTVRAWKFSILKQNENNC